jgi:hypothetical protein
MRFMGTRFVLIGDFCQLPSVNDRFAEALPADGMLQTKVLMSIANHLRLPFRTNYRCAGFPDHFDYLLSLREAGAYKPDFDRFPVDLSVLPDLAITQCLATRVAMNALTNRREGIFLIKPAKWSPPEPQDCWVYPGLPVIGTRRRNGLWFEVAAASEESITLDDGTALSPAEFMREFRLGLAVTAHCIQGKTLRGVRVWFLDSHAFHTSKAHYLVAASRCDDPGNFGVVTPEQQCELISTSRALSSGQSP